MKEKVVVIGAGIAGLSLSINLLKKGYDVTLVEKNSEVGGLCSGYFVDGYYIDACLHWLMGTNKKSSLYKMWSDVGAFDKDTKIISLPTLGTIEYEGTKVTFYRNIEKTRKEWTKISPQDKKIIDKFIDSVIDMSSLMGLSQKYKKLKLFDIIHMLPNSPHIVRCMKLSREDYSKRFKHPALQFAIKNCQTGYNNMFFFLDLYGIFIKGNADIPSGGAYYMVQRMKKLLQNLGGNLLLNTEVIGLLTRNSRVFAAKTPNFDIEGDYFVSAIDPNLTLNKLLNNKYKVRKVKSLDRRIKSNPISSCYNLYCLVKGDTSKIEVPHGLHIKPIQIGCSKVDFALIRPYHFDPEYFTKDGKNVISIFVDQNQDDYFYFKSLSDEEYKKKVNDINSKLIEEFTNNYPQFKDKVKALSCFSPLELEKRTNSSYGALQAYSFSKDGAFYHLNGEVKGLDNFYLCSQWNRAIGGTPTALLTAFEISKRFKKK